MASVPAQTAVPKDGGGKQASEFIGPDLVISESGAVTGTLRKVASLDSFPGVKGGHFLPITLGSTYAGKDITVTGVNGPHTAQDLEWLCQVKDTSTTLTFQTGGATFLTLTFAGATFE